ncbi:cystatin-2-like [Scleropages formosus]|uniref:cystatin-2-like n=1 Tax=Scleropages formosus TaxID=113540 RepID=UPI0010FA7444|nr:cystatin-2-like [Scleropages formosus]
MACWWLAVCLLSGIAAGEQLVGGLQVDSPDDPQVTQAARIAVNLYNRQSDDMYMYSVVKVISAESQVVAGVIYYLDVETVRCMKRQSPHMESCPQSDKTEVINVALIRHQCGCKNTNECFTFLGILSPQTFVCHFELLEVPWENSNQLLKVQCRPSVPKVSASALLGGITPLSPDTPRVQQLAQYAVNQYRLDGQDKYTYSMIKVLSAQEQVRLLLTQTASTRRASPARHVTDAVPTGGERTAILPASSDGRMR